MRSRGSTRYDAAASDDSEIRLGGAVHRRAHRRHGAGSTSAMVTVRGGVSTMPPRRMTVTSATRPTTVRPVASVGLSIAERTGATVGGIYFWLS